MGRFSKSTALQWVLGTECRFHSRAENLSEFHGRDPSVRAAGVWPRADGPVLDSHAAKRFRPLDLGTRGQCETLNQPSEAVTVCKVPEVGEPLGGASLTNTLAMQGNTGSNPGRGTHGPLRGDKVVTESRADRSCLQSARAPVARTTSAQRGTSLSSRSRISSGPPSIIVKPMLVMVSLSGLEPGRWQGAG